jgi:hypothetical protein
MIIVPVYFRKTDRQERKREKMMNVVRGAVGRDILFKQSALRVSKCEASCNGVSKQRRHRRQVHNTLHLRISTHGGILLECEKRKVTNKTAVSNG